MIKELANEFEGPFQCTGGNSEIYKSFSVPIKKKIVKIDKEGNKTDGSISQKIKFIDSMRFMATSLTKLVYNLSEIYRKKSRDKHWKSECELKGVKNSKLSYNCKKYSKEQLKPVNCIN